MMFSYAMCWMTSVLVKGEDGSIEQPTVFLNCASCFVSSRIWEVKFQVIYKFISKIKETWLAGLGAAYNPSNSGP